METIKKRWQQWQSIRLTHRILAYLFALIAMILIAAPYAIELTIEKVLKDQGATVSEVEDVDFNLFTGRASVTNLYAEFPDEEPLELGYFEVDIDWLSLFRQRVVVDVLELHGIGLEVIFEPGRMINVGGIQIPLTQKENLSEAEQEKQQEQQEPSSWNFGVNELVLINSNVHFIGPEIDKHINFYHVTISDFQNWAPDEASALSFAVDIGEGTFVGNYDLKLFSETQEADGTIIFDDLYLQSYQLVVDQLQIDQANLDGRFSMKITNHFGDIKATNRGYLQIRQFKLKRDAIQGDAKLFHWEGDMQAHMTPDKNMTASLNSNIKLDQFNAELDDLSLSLEKLRLNGQYQFEKQDQQMIVKTAQDLLLSLFDYDQNQMDAQFEKIHWQGQSQATISGEQMQGEADGNLSLKSIALLQPSMQLSLGEAGWQGHVNFEKLADDLTANTDSRLQAIGIGLQQQNNQISLTHAKWQGKGHISQSKETKHADTAGNLDLKQVRVKQPEQLISLEQLNWQGSVAMDQNQQDLHIDNVTNLLLSGIGVQQKNANISVKQSQLKSKVQMTKSPKEIKVTTKDDKVTEGIQLKTEGALVKVQKSTWKGTSSILQPKDQKPQIDIQGKKALISTVVYQKQLRLGVGGISWDGKVQARPGTEKTVVSTGHTRLANIKLTNPKQKMMIAEVKKIQTDVDFASPKAVAMNDFKVNAIKVAQRNPNQREAIFLKEVSVSHLKMKDEKNIDIGKILLTNLDVDLLFYDKLKAQRIEALKQALKTEETAKATPTQSVKSSEKTNAEQPTAEKTAEGEAKDKINFRMTSFDMTGENKIHIMSYATDPRIETHLQIVKAHVGEMDTQKPTQNTPIDFEMTGDRYATMTSKGEVQPFNEKVNGDVKTVIDDLNLYTFSPLIKRDLGYIIQSGTFNFDSDVKIKDNYLTSENNVLLAGFEMQADEPTKEEKAQAEKEAKAIKAAGEKVEEDKGRPISPFALKFGLNLIRDRHDNIDLDLPVEGDLSDPKFDASSAINVAMRNAMMAGSKVALAMALQPFGAIAVASSYAIGAATRTTFEPVVFEPGLNKMTPEMTDYLNKLSKLLNEKQGITLKVCGYYTAADTQVLKDKGVEAKELKQTAYDLARDRQHQVKSFIVQKGIASRRMTTCHPAEKDSPKTGVSLSM